MAEDTRTQQAGPPEASDAPRRDPSGAAVGPRPGEGLAALERAAAFLLVEQAQDVYRRCSGCPDAAVALRLFCDAEALRQRALEHAVGVDGGLLQQVHGVLEGEREAALQSLRDPLEARPAVHGVRAPLGVVPRGDLDPSRP